jgi:hypothetical protein
MKKYHIVIIVFLVLGLGGGAFYFWFSHRGMDYTDWSAVEKKFEDCQIAAVDQTHGRLVNLTLKDGNIIYSLEPQKDVAIDLVVSNLAKCGKIDLKTK